VHVLHATPWAATIAWVTSSSSGVAAPWPPPAGPGFQDQGLAAVAALQTVLVTSSRQSLRIAQAFLDFRYEIVAEFDFDIAEPRLDFSASSSAASVCTNSTIALANSRVLRRSLGKRALLEGLQHAGPPEVSLLKKGAILKQCNNCNVVVHAQK
jgi:hypothetical protein